MQPYLAFHLLRKRIGLTRAAVLSLRLGISISTTVFPLIYTIFLVPAARPNSPAGIYSQVPQTRAATPRKASPSSGSRTPLAAALNTASTLHSPDPSATLANRWSWGLQVSRRSPAGAWIGYSIDRPMDSNEWIGTISALSEIEDLTDSRARKAGQLHKAVAMLLAVPVRGVALESIQVSNVELPVNLGHRRIVWLGKAGDTESLDLLERLFGVVGDTGVKADLVEAIGVHTTPSRVIPFLLSILSGQDAEEVRAAAASGLGRHESKASCIALAEAGRTDRSLRVRQEAVQGLARHRSSAALDDLIHTARKGSPAEVRRVATEELGRWPDASSLSVLVDIANRDPDTEIQRTAAEALGNLPDGAGVAALQKIAREHPTPDVRRQAVESLEMIFAQENSSR